MTPTTTRKTGPKGTNQLTGSSGFRQAGPSKITALRVRGTGLMIEVPAMVSFTLGRVPTEGDPAEPRADVLVPSGRKGVSLVHATFEWRGDRLWCRDERSTNGVFVNGEQQHDWFSAASGTVLDLGDASVIALDRRLVELCDPLAWCLGLDGIREVDRALSIVQKDEPLLLLGPRGGDQAWLARRIHDASGRREQPFTEFTTKLPRGAESALIEARWGTVFIDLAAVSKVTKGFAGALMADDGTHLGVRPIIAASSYNAYQRAFQHMARTPVLQIPPLASRCSEVPRLVDRLMIEAQSSQRVHQLGTARLERLVAHSWSGNLVELREAEKRIRAFLESSSMSQAAKLVGTSRQALDKFLRRIFKSDLG